jgi:hypothetical protein
VPGYRGYVIGNKGQILKRYEFESLDDVSALVHASQYVDVKKVEVWQLDRCVGTLGTPMEEHQDRVGILVSPGVFIPR